jgi:hypothetical protein
MWFGVMFRLMQNEASPQPSDFRIEREIDLSGS